MSSPAGPINLGHPHSRIFRRLSRGLSVAVDLQVSHAASMARSRAQIVSPEGAEGCYHCVQRCVRRALLRGNDELTGRNFEHRKNWIRERLHRLGECFAVAIHAYAVMSNHLHIVLQFNAATSAEWSDEETASRWIWLFPPREDSDTRER